MKTRNALAGLFGMLAAATSSTFVQAQDYPNREIKLVVGYAPGGITNTLARILADKMSDILGQRVIVENRAGVNGAIATRAVKRAAADGYTLIFNSTNMAMNLAGLKEPGYQWDDFVLVNGFAYGPLVLVANTASSKAKTLKELVEFGKANPGKLSFATLGPQSIQNVASERLNNLTGIGWRQIPYKGVDQVIPDIINGTVDAYFFVPNTAVQVLNQPNIVALAVTDKRRMGLMPNVPTFIEAGYPAINDYAMAGVWTPAGTPKPIVDKLRTAITDVMKTKEMKELIEKTGYVLYMEPPEQFDTEIRKQTGQYGADFKKLGIEPQ
jgi:tripartite-type tricarboxylate transporter receptor subunit TctC